MIDVNVKGALYAAAAAVPHLIAAGGGDVVSVASEAGRRGLPNEAVYCASKFAQVAFTEVLHHENRGRGVQILCVCPSQVDTPLRAQALTQPRIMQLGPAPQSPESVVDAVERAIGGRRLFVFARWHTEIAWRLRRFLPWVFWRIDHRAEGI